MEEVDKYRGEKTVRTSEIYGKYRRASEWGGESVERKGVWRQVTVRRRKREWGGCNEKEIQKILWERRGEKQRDGGEREGVREGRGRDGGEKEVEGGEWERGRGEREVGRTEIEREGERERGKEGERGGEVGERGGEVGERGREGGRRREKVGERGRRR